MRKPTFWFMTWSEADLRLYFRICKTLVFSRFGSFFFHSAINHYANEEYEMFVFDIICRSGSR